MTRITGSGELFGATLGALETHGVEYDEQNNTIVFTHMYRVQNDAGEWEGGYDIDLAELSSVQAVLETLEHICNKPQIKKEHIQEFLRLSLSLIQKS